METTAVAQLEPGIVQIVNKYRGDFERLLPLGMAVRFMAVANSMFKTNPKLLDCSADSIMDCLMKSAQLGILPDGIRAYIIPYKDTATFQVGYKGLMELAIRSEKVSKIFSSIVCKNDLFDYALGLKEKLEHHPALSDRGEMIGAYAYAVLTDGGTVQDYMSKEEIDAIRERSQSYRLHLKAVREGSPAGKPCPWTTDYAEMARKTVVKRLSKYLPMAENLMTAVAMDDIADADSDGVFIEPSAAPVIQKSGMAKLKSAVMPKQPVDEFENAKPMGERLGKPVTREPGDDDVLDKHARLVGIKQAITHGDDAERDEAWGLWVKVQLDYSPEENREIGRLYKSMKK